MPRSPSEEINAGARLKINFLPLLFSTLGTVVALYPSNPNNVTLPSRDSGVFLYMGWRLLNGDIPYRNVWDHKPPLVYFVDAVGLTLTPHSLWGVWFLQFIFILLTIFLIYKTLDKEFGHIPAATGMIILSTGLLNIIERGNVTEEYALAFQALGIWLFVQAKERGYPLKETFWIGLCGGLAFYFKQTTIGVWIVYALLLGANRFKQKKYPISDLLSLATGWSIPIVGFAVYFYANGALYDFWEQAFVYNFIYIGKHEGIQRLIPVFIKGFAFLRQGGGLYFALAGLLAGLIYLWLKRKELLKKANLLILFAVINLPIEVLFVLISGRSILHYYLTPLPVMAILSGALIYLLPQVTGKLFPGAATKGNLIASISLLIIMAFQLPVALNYSSHMKDLGKNNLAPVIEYVAKNTKEDDRVLVIGAESVVNFLARREAPTRYVYQYPLALLGRRAMFDEYFNQILDNDPVLIIDTRGRASLTDRLYEPLQKRSEIVRDGVKYLGENYEQVAQYEEWFVYRLKEKQ